MRTQSIKRLSLTLATAALLAAVFATPASAAPPKATIGAATDVTSSTATLNGVVETEGVETAYAFEYGTTTEYGTRAGGGVLSQFAPANVNVVLTGLKPETTYHFHLGALNEKGFSESGDETFTTLSDHSPQFEAEEYPATISGEQDSKAKLKLTFLGQSLECTTAQFSGKASAASASLPLGATYSGCTYGAKNVTVSMNSCGYAFNVANVSAPYTGTMASTCTTEGDVIKLTIHKYSGESDCVVSIAAQSFGGSVSYTNNGEGHGSTVRAGLSASGIVLKSSGPGLSCKAIGESKATLSGGVILKGSNEAKEQIGFSVKGEKPFGLRVTGEKSEEVGKQPRFEAEEYAATISGEQDSKAKLKLTFLGQSLECTTAQFSGKASAASASLPLGATYSGCTYGAKNVTVSMNSCGYAFNVANVSAPYTGTMASTCTTEGDVIKLTIHKYSGESDCVVSIAAQSFGGSVSYTNNGEGHGSTVRAGLSASGIVLKSSGPGLSCKAIGESKATLSGGVILGQVQ